MTTRIVMSFAMADGGMMFVQWLRNRLMKHYGLFSTNSVYVDFVTARSGDAVYGVEADSAPPHFASVKLDTRDHMRSASGAQPIGAMQPDWKPMFEAAMNEAEVVLFVLTRGFMDSQWCRQELDGFKVVMDKKPKVRGVVLDLDGIGFDAGARGLSSSRIQVVSGARVASQGGMLWDRGLWAISESTYGQLVKAIGSHGNWREG